MDYAYLHFFNIQYWYCVIISLFGAKCTYVDTYTGQAISFGGDLGSGAGGGTASPGFWDWLFGAHTASGGVESAPGFFGTIFAIVGAIFGFLWSVFSAIAYTASFLLFLIIVGSLVGLFLIRVREREMYGNLPPTTERLHPLRDRWQTLIHLAMSANPAEWKEAILGADELLGELLAKLGYEGNTTAERIQRVSDSAFANLPSAWEAHRVHNFVFAPSSHYILTQREAFRTMKLYEKVFTEFDFI